MDRTTNEMLESSSDLTNQTVKPGGVSSADGTDTSSQRVSFAKDPYVADGVVGDPKSFAPPPKSIEEILQNINGYQIELEENEAVSMKPQVQTPPPKKAAENSVEETCDRTIKCETMPANSNYFRSADTELRDPFDDSVQPEFDVRTFHDAEAVVEGVPEPIRGAFEVDQDYFDYLAPESAEVGRQPRDLHKSTSSETATIPEKADNCFWANADDVIYIDGKAGFGHIDLACFDISAATFQSNQIKIVCDDGLSFQIDYRNVTHAVFANGVEVELAAYEPDFDQEA